MNAPLSNRIEQLARAYWQPLVLAVLMFLVLSQVYSWGVAAIELSKVDGLIEETEDTSPPITDGEKPKTPGKPGSTPGKPPQRKEPPKKPAKNIFKKEQVNYNLTAIYMNKAVINGQTVEEGGKIGKATLKEIGLWDATIEVEGATRKLEMFKSGGSGPSSGSMRSRPPSRSKSKSKTSKAKPVKSGSSSRSLRDMTMRELKSLPPGEGRRLWENASQKDRDNIMEREKDSASRGGDRGGREVRVIRGGRTVSVDVIGK